MKENRVTQWNEPRLARRHGSLAATLLLALGGLLLFSVAVQAQGPAPGSVLRDCDQCPEMVVIPPGSFQMGSTPEETDRESMPPLYAANEKPRHQVTIQKAFAIGKVEITKAQYSAFAAATQRDDGFFCRIYDSKGVLFVTTPGKTWKDPGFPQTDDHPVVCVSWDDAAAYANWLSSKTGKKYRLPSEAEWEYAARGGTATARWWGDAVDGACTYANVGDLDAGDGPYLWGKTGAPVTYDLKGGERLVRCRDGYVFTAPVERYKPNAYGLYDMLGNAWEWVADCRHDTYAGAPTDGSAWDAAASQCISGFRVNRGASWAHFPWGIRAALRNTNPADSRFYTQGFRIAREMD